MLAATTGSWSIVSGSDPASRGSHSASSARAPAVSLARARPRAWTSTIGSRAAGGRPATSAAASLAAARPRCWSPIVRLSSAAWLRIAAARTGSPARVRAARSSSSSRASMGWPLHICTRHCRWHAVVIRSGSSVSISARSSSGVAAATFPAVCAVRAASSSRRMRAGPDGLSRAARSSSASAVTWLLRAAAPRAAAVSCAATSSSVPGAAAARWKARRSAAPGPARRPCTAASARCAARLRPGVAAW